MGRSRLSANLVCEATWWGQQRLQMSQVVGAKQKEHAEIDSDVPLAERMRRARSDMQTIFGSAMRSMMILNG